MSQVEYDKVNEAADFIRARMGDLTPDIALILGSGLGSFADEVQNSHAIDFSDIPHFPVSSVHGHAGQLVIGAVEGMGAIAMKGRVHFYEGHSATTVAFPARVLVTLGAKTLIITNAAGGIRNGFTPGTLMLISDHINMLPDHPLRGVNDERFGPRFPDMSNAYCKGLRQVAKSAATQLGIRIEEGVYAAMPGPTYETPAEINMLKAMGADAVGMSTVPETIVANHMGARVLGISCITNLAAGISKTPLSHDEVTETATRIRAKFVGLLRGTLKALAN